MTIIVVTLYILVVLLDFLPSRKEKGKKENIIYFTFLTISFSVLILYSFNIFVPGPAEPIKRVIDLFFNVSG